MHAHAVRKECSQEKSLNGSWQHYVMCETLCMILLNIEIVAERKRV